MLNDINKTSSINVSTILKLTRTIRVSRIQSNPRNGYVFSRRAIDTAKLKGEKTDKDKR